MRYEEAAFVYLGAFVEALARAGVRDVCLAPGSRSTPLALMLARNPAVKLWLQLDERSTAFFALGLAKASGRPVGLLCTSGTAAANFFPAVIEARYGQVPLVVMTADRPPELRDAGAAQTIDQVRLYGAHVKWSVEVPLPEATPELLRYARTLAARAATSALESPAGPVHLNFPLREPLIPVAPEQLPHDEFVRDAPVRVERARRVPDEAVLAGLADRLRSAERGLIVAGPQPDPALAEPLARLARRLGFPVLADPLSGLRCGPREPEAIVDSYDAFLRSPRVAEALRPDLVLRFGAIPTSKPTLQFLEKHVGARQVLLGAGWEDPSSLASDAILADPAATCEALLRWIDEPHSQDYGWLAIWRALDRASRDAIAAFIDRLDEPFEGRVFAELARVLPEGSTLYASSSMPVRDLDSFVPASRRAIRFLANRGANGIDGVVSSALGASVASNGPLLLAIGDIALYHDMNGLLAAKLHQLDATIVLLNNDGGGIFSFLPQARHPEHFEALFGTPHGLDFQPVAQLYGAAYRLIEDWADFAPVAERALAAPGLKLIELRSERARNVELHQAVWHAAAAAAENEVARCVTR
ncbi:MAG TPA: 2-succinyl-5-enolpyruvyl-6-hydroxy-3-cyclohexene-1-carboxylic-acid synthase [Thermomicrobiaceae bacterium]|nr:2-succinyl-5-enolpyruvyl-6-hydroxy-3-cyclohexene-1-carboxylic-acid synthase [Thermomicrobiaceae bacterium]